MRGASAGVALSLAKRSQKVLTGRLGEPGVGEGGGGGGSGHSRVVRSGCFCLHHSFNAAEPTKTNPR